jgi:chorismate synthase
LTAGESHGPALSVIVEGLPVGLPVSRESIHRDLRRRMGGYGRGGRMQIERDEVEILGGVRFGRTLGSPVCLVIRNRDFAQWARAMDPESVPEDAADRKTFTRPRPGHADLAGALKYRTHDARDILERASARETAARTAAGALARGLLRECGIEVTSRTVAVGGVNDGELSDARFDELLALPDDAPFRCLDPALCQAMIREVDRARGSGDSIGGVFEVLARGVPPGLGSHAHWDRRLDARIGGALLSIQAVKAVSLGEGIEAAHRSGSEHHDPILYDESRRCFLRGSNRAGGIEGGVSNGSPVRARAYLKPLATVERGAPSVDLVSKLPVQAATERTDTIPIVAAGVVGEAMVSLVLAEELLIKFGGDRLEDVQGALSAYLDSLRRY